MRARPPGAVCRLHHSTFRIQPADSQPPSILSVNQRCLTPNEILEVQTRSLATTAPSNLDQNEAASDRRHSLKHWKIDPQLQDIVKDDLKATLEAHQKSNKQLRFRYYGLGPELEAESTSPPAEAGSNSITAPQGKRERFYLDEKPKKIKYQFASPDAHAHRHRRSWAISETGKGEYVPTTKYMITDAVPQRPSSFSSLESIGGHGRRETIAKNITELRREIELTQPERDYRDGRANRILKKLREEHPGVELEITGSQVSSLGTSLSDVDIAFSIKSLSDKAHTRGPSAGLGDKRNRRLVRTQLEGFGVSLNRSLTVKALIPYSEFPQLRLLDGRTRVEFQLVYSPHSLGSVAYTSIYMADYPHLRDIFFLMNAALASRGLRDPSQGGLGSYPLFMMIVASFKILRLDRKTDLVDALLGFLNFYATLDTSKWALTADPAGQSDKSQFQDGRLLSRKVKDLVNYDKNFHALSVAAAQGKGQKWRLCLQDPADTSNDLGRRCFGFLDIQAVFKVLHARTVGYLSSSAKPDNSNTDLIDFYIGNFLDAVYARRSFFERWSRTSSAIRNLPNAGSGSNQRHEPDIMHDVDRAKILKAGRQAIRANDGMETSAATTSFMRTDLSSQVPAFQAQQPP